MTSDSPVTDVTSALGWTSPRKATAKGSRQKSISILEQLFNLEFQAKKVTKIKKEKRICFGSMDGHVSIREGLE